MLAFNKKRSGIEKNAPLSIISLPTLSHEHGRVTKNVKEEQKEWDAGKEIKKKKETAESSLPFRNFLRRIDSVLPFVDALKVDGWPSQPWEPTFTVSQFPERLIQPPPPPLPPPPLTKLIPHIEVGFKWMWTQLATPNKMAPVFVDLCAGLVVLLPRQIRRFRHGFFLSAVLDWSLRSCLRVRHLWRQQIADNRRYLRWSFLPWTSSLRSQISLSKRR